MKIQFYKYHGTGNDFVIIDNRKKRYSLSKEQITSICNRRFGIGADGLMFLNSDKNYDFKMEYYNSDGSSGMMCGNGGRCIVAFAKFKNIVSKKAEFTASDGYHIAEINENFIVNLKMKDVKNIDKINEDLYCNTGSPHYIKYVLETEKTNVFKEAQKIRYSEMYKNKGVNVNFIQKISDNEINIRTYERGVENETYSCGTGAVASALAHAKTNNLNSINCTLNTKGGKLFVSAEYKDSKYENIWLKGATKLVFTGEIDV